MSVMNWKPRYRKSVSVGRLRLSLTVYVHKYTLGVGDRWVIQPEVIWDRK